MQGCQILCVLRACIIFTEKTCHTQKTVLAVLFWIEAAMSSVMAVQGSRNAVFSPNPQAEEFKSTPLGRRKLLCSDREPSLSVAEEKGTQDQPSTTEQRGRYTRECNMIKSICKCNSGQETSRVLL